MPRMLARFTLALLVATPAFAAQPLVPTVRILFIGNSLTYTNDLPHMVAAIGAIARVRIVTGMVAKPDYSLEDHLDDGAAAIALRHGSWDYVVMQQGPSALPESRVILIRDAQRWATLIAAVHAKPAMLMVWPERWRLYDLDRVAESYRLAAEAIHGAFIPAGNAWRRAPLLPVYGADDFHPTPIGTYLAALTVYRTLFGPLRDLLARADVASDIAGISMTSDQAGEALRAAEEAVGESEPPIVAYSRNSAAPAVPIYGAILSLRRILASGGGFGHVEQIDGQVPRGQGSGLRRVPKTPGRAHGRAGPEGDRGPLRRRSGHSRFSVAQEAA
ncbi:MAG TPA: hypothetical protein VN605_06330, partial [Thermoanaerobaculia bacterium]|nr:hypothetical protein [Thermoanaerobaculia bacterium]